MELRVEKNLPPRGLVEDCRAGDIKHLHDALDLLTLVLPREEREARVQLCEDAGKAPHVNGGAIGEAEDDFWRSVESTLDVCVDPLVSYTGTTKVDDFDD